MAKSALLSSQRVACVAWVVTDAAERTSRPAWFFVRTAYVEVSSIGFGIVGSFPPRDS